MATVEARSWAQAVRLAVGLARASNLPTVWSNVMVGVLLTGQSWNGDVALMLAGGSLAYAGGCTLNDAFDVDWDRAHRPDRPIPSGRISAGAVWWLGGGELALGAGIMAGAGCGWPLVAGLVGMILLYDWCHKRTAWAVVPMGLCRVLLGWNAASMIGRIWPPGEGVALWLAGLFAYIVGLTLVARGEATGGRTSWPGVALGVSPLVGALAANRLIGADFRDWLLGLVLWGLWFRDVWLTLRRRDTPDRIGQAVARMLAGVVVVDFLFVAQVNWHWGAVWAGLLATAVLWQRRVAAT